MKKVKRYQQGGEAEGLSGTAGRMRGDKKPRTTDDMTFGQAFRAARNEGKGTFMWRGNKYTTETKAEKPKASVDMDTDTMSAGTKGGPSARRGERRPSEASDEPKKKKTFTGAVAATIGTAGQRKRGAEEGYKAGDIGKAITAGLGTRRQRDELADEYEGVKVDPMTVAGAAVGGAGGAGLRYGARRLLGGRLAGGRGGESLAQRRIREAADKEAERVGRGVSRRGMPSYSERYRAGETAASRRADFRQRQREAAERRLDERLASDMEGGFKRGGSIKKYNKGGKIDGVAKRGKTRCRII